MWAPAKTPKAELDRMQAALKQVLAMPDVRDILVNKQTMQPGLPPRRGARQAAAQGARVLGPRDQGHRLQAGAVSDTNGHAMSLNGKAYIVGAYEHPTRKADDLSVVRLHADVAKGALDDAGLSQGRHRRLLLRRRCAGARHDDDGGVPRPQAAPCRLDRMRRLGADPACRACGRRRSPPAAATSR